MQKRPTLQEVLPKSGLVVSEKGGLTELLCKPKLLPLKSITLQKLEEMEVSSNLNRQLHSFQHLRQSDCNRLALLKQVASPLRACRGLCCCVWPRFVAVLQLVKMQGAHHV